MHRYLMKMLLCPACHGELDWSIVHQTDDRLEEAEARCRSCSRIYPVREGIGLFLLDELQRNDLWEQVDSGLMKHFKSNPEQYERLMAAPLEILAPPDQFLRGMILEELGRFAEAKEAHETAMHGLYTKEYLNCFKKQVDYVIKEISTGNDPIVDLASGRGYLVQQIAIKSSRLITATDFSPRVLRHSRKRLEFEGLYERVSLLAVDARRTPFRDHSVPVLTTNLGLPNIEEPGALARELRRITARTFLAISHFYLESDQGNGPKIRELGLDVFLYRQSALEHFTRAGWQVELRNACTGRARPTPPSTIIEGLRMDALPVSNTELEWGVLVAT